MITRRFAIVFMLVGAVGAMHVSAHDEFRIIGTLEKHQNSTIAVKKNADGKVVSIKIDKQTAITQDKKKVDASALKVGQSLVVDSYGDTETDSLALEIRIVPPIKRSR
jgi:hypothetical protein